MVALIAEHLSCQRGGRLVFEDLSLRLEEGQILHLSGPNGSGKSSLLRLIAGLGDALAGRIELMGGHAELSIGQQSHLIGHQDAVKPALTVEENIQFWGGYLGGGDAKRALTEFELESLGPYPAGLLSAGQQRRLALSRLILVPRLVWLLDEPTVGLDPGSLERLDRLIGRHLGRGGLAIVASHVGLGVMPHLKIDLGLAA